MTNLTRNQLIIGAVAIVVVAALAVLGFLLMKSKGDASARILATDFVTQLKNVPLTAEEEQVQAAINQYYAAYVTPELLQEWLANTEEAPGRTVEGEWPDRIFIKSVTKQGSSYVINADVLYVTSAEAESAEEDASGVVVVTIMVVPTEDGYRIAAYEELFGEDIEV